MGAFSQFHLFSVCSAKVLKEFYFLKMSSEISKESLPKASKTMESVKINGDMDVESDKQVDAVKVNGAKKEALEDAVESKESTEASDEAKPLVDPLVLLAQGKRNLMCNEAPQAVTALQECCRLLAEKHGETGEQLGEAYLTYGTALLDVARMESGVLGNALEGIEDETDDEKDSAAIEADELTAEEKEKISDEIIDALTEERPAPKAKSEDGEKDKKDEIKTEEMECEEVPKATEKKKSPEKTEKKKSPEKTEQKKSPEKTEQKKSPEKTEKKKSPEKTEKKKSPEKISPGKKVSPGKKTSPGKTDEVSSTADKVELATDKSDKETDKEEKEKIEEKSKPSPSKHSPTKEDKTKEIAKDDKDLKMDCDEESKSQEKTEETSTKEQVVTEEVLKDDSKSSPSKSDVNKEDAEEDEEDMEEGTADEDTADDEEVDKENDPNRTQDEDVTNLQLAWEILELSKVIFSRTEDKETQLKLAESHLKLGEVSLETERYDEAITDLETCLKIQCTHLNKDSRLIADTHYQIGVACSLAQRYEMSIEHLKSALIKCF